jgi:hypothetical protein
VSQGYAGLRLAERLEHQFNERAKVWQTADLTPQVDRFRKFLVNAELGVCSAITTHVSLRVVLQNIYDSIPAPGRQANDIRLISGFEYRF